MRRELLSLGTVTVVAPATEQSAAGHSVTLTTPLTFSGVASTVIWLGNGYGDTTAAGTWTGTVTLIGLSNTAPVPEPQSWALFAAGAAGLAGWMGRRRRPAASLR